MTTTTYNLYKLRATIHEHEKCLLDPITAIQSSKILDNWYNGVMSEAAAVTKLEKLGILDEGEKGVIT